MTTPSLFPERLAAVPLQPGVYIMRGTSAEVLYVGKASALRNRLRSYFSSPGALLGKTAELVGRVADFEFIVTESEQEALLLENSLIKKHRPKYNARLKDDKTYPYIKVDLDDPFPRVYVTRRTEDGKSKYFGPFASAGSVRKTLDLLNRLFPYRSCTKAITGTDDRPCLEYHIKRCIAPCTGYASKEDYRQVIDQVVMFLEGNTRDVISGLKEEMLVASDGMEFERAAALRDRLRAIERVYEGQKVVGLGDENLDAIAVALGRNEAWVEVFFVRQGNLAGRDNFIMENTEDRSEAEIISDFIEQFYDSASHVPRHVLVAADIEDRVLIEAWLAGKRGGKVEIAVPQRGEKRRLVDMVRENAAQGLEQLKIKWLSDTDLMGQAMASLQEELSLPRLPRRIECFDISHIQGTNMVASMAVFEDGRPRKAHYRRFKIKSVPGNDDFASMREVLARRFKRLKDSMGAPPLPPGTSGQPPAMSALQGDASLGVDATIPLPNEERVPAIDALAQRPGLSGHADVSDLSDPYESSEASEVSQASEFSDSSEVSEAAEASDSSEVSEVSEGSEPSDPSLASFGEMPDLVLIDGGKGQLNVAVETLLYLGLKDIPLASLAKQQEEIYVPHNPEPVVLPRNSQALFLVQRIRDEAHRFAVTFHRERRQKSSVQSALDLVPGIGPKRKRALIRRFGSVKGIKEATLEELASVPGMTATLSEKVKRYL